MLGFKKSTLLFAVMILSVMILNIFVCLPLWFYFIIFLSYVFVIAVGSARINSGFFLPVTCNGDNMEKSIAITFDDGPVPDSTPRILEILKRTNTPATFFCIGKNVKLQPGLVKQIDQEGHLLGNHSYSHHFFFDFYSARKIKWELTETNSLIFELTNKKIRFFRPPYGVTTPNIAKAVEEGDFDAIGWSVRSMDTVIRNKESLLKKTAENIKSGDVILFHDTVELTVQILQEFIEKVRQQGFQIVRLDHLLKLKAYA